jgi:DNA polymerase epsilon subunit 3
LKPSSKVSSCCPSNASKLTATGFNDIQTDKRNQYRKRVAADKETGKAGSPHGEDDETLAEVDMEGPLDREGQPASKKARRETSDSTVEDMNELREPDIMGDREDEEGNDDEGHGDDPEDEEDEDQEERLEVEEQLDEAEQRDVEDEALDNGEDSD